MGDERYNISRDQEMHGPGEWSAPPPGYHDREQPRDVKTDAETASINSSIPPNANADDETGSINSSILSDPPTAQINTNGPDVAHPFAFPELTSPPSYSAIYQLQKPLAIPQTNPSPDAGFFSAYSPSLLTYGIPESTWLSFISTLSSFLDATAGKHAIRHASKVAKSTAEIPKSLGKNIYSHTVSDVKNIGSFARRGNIFGVVGTVIGWPFGVAGNVVHSVFSIPNVVTQRPQTPRQRADVYVETANKKWFHARRLHAKTMNTVELAYALNLSMDEFLGIETRDSSSTTVQEKLGSLAQWIEELKVVSGVDAQNGEVPLENTKSRSSGKGKQKMMPPMLQLGPGTLWLVLVQGEVAMEAAQGTKTEKGANIR